MNDPESSAMPQSEPVTLEQLAARLGPFSPPVSFDHGDEFLPAPPRPLPAYLKQGSHARRQRGMLYCLFALGIMCLVFAPLPFVRGLSHYILPLAYLHWIGLGLVAFGFISLFYGFVSSGRFIYVRQGQPVVGRVLSIGQTQEGTAEQPQFRFLAAVEFDHPDTGQHVFQAFPAEDAWPVAEVARHSCTVQPGDYVTVLSLPGKSDAAMKVYGFLGLDPELEFFHKNGRPMQGTSPFTAIMIALLISLIVLMVMAFFDLMMFSFPVGGDWKLPTLIAIAGAVLGAGLFVGLSALQKPEASGQPSKSGRGAAILAGGLLGAIAGPLLFMILNAKLDAQAGSLEPIEIVQFWETTHNFIVRDYEVEYQPLNGGQQEKKHIRYSQMERLGNASHGVLEVSPGKFGYPWGRAIYPISWQPYSGPPLEVLEDGTPLFAFTLTDPDLDNGSPTTVVAFPVVDVSDKVYLTCPEALVQPVASRFREEFPDLRPAKLSDMQPETNQ